MAADFAGMPLHVTLSDGEGTGSVAVAWWQPHNIVLPRFHEEVYRGAEVIAGGEVMTLRPEKQRTHTHTLSLSLFVNTWKIPKMGTT